MNEQLLTTLANLERLGTTEVGTKPADQNITHETGEFLSILIKATKSRTVLELGSATGYSTIWLADAVAKTGGKVVTVGSDNCNRVLKSQNIREAGVNDLVEIFNGKQEEFFVKKGKEFDFIFLDSEPSLYGNWWPDLQNLIKRGGLIVVDNANSHLDELSGFISMVAITESFETSIVPIGDGVLLIWKGLNHSAGNF